MLNLKKEVLHRPAGQIYAPALKQSKNDEVAVPSVHLVESPARDDVRVRQVKQPLRGQSNILTKMFDFHGEPLHIHSTLLPERRDLRRLSKILRQVEDWLSCHLGIHQRRAIEHRALQGFPRVVDVSVDATARSRQSWRPFRTGWLRTSIGLPKGEHPGQS
jgi:hypothetical protein